MENNDSKSKNSPNPVSSWFHALIGKPLPKTDSKEPAQKDPVKTPAQQVPVTQETVTPPQPPPVLDLADETDPLRQEDVIISDLKKAKKFLNAKFGILKKSAQPYVDKTAGQGAQVSDSAVTSYKKLISENRLFIRKTAKRFIILLFIILILFVGYNIAKNYLTPEPEKPPEVEVTPSLIEYKPTLPSIYASDPVVLAFEENLKVLDQELINTNVRVTTITLPNLDFNISF